MKIQNLKILRTYPFEQYLELPGWSHSTIHNDGRTFTKPTPKMQLGTDVHNYLLEPENYHHENRHIVRPIAKQLQKTIGPVLLKHLEPELAVTCNFIHEGFNLAYKGRIDLGIVGRLVIDIKISKQPLARGIIAFGYDNQLSGYALSIGAPVALIIRCDPDTKFIELFNVPINMDWWHFQIVSKGEPII